MWIKSKRRLLKEADMMHHCVATYTDKINRDGCAIYSLVYGETRYAIEFVINGGKYSVRQIQSAYDRGYPDEVWEYVENCIKNIEKAG